jgi:hypothetical protein
MDEIGKHASRHPLNMLAWPGRTISVVDDNTGVARRGQHVMSDSTPINHQVNQKGIQLAIDHNLGTPGACSKHSPSHILFSILVHHSH